MTSDPAAPPILSPRAAVQEQPAATATRRPNRRGRAEQLVGAVRTRWPILVLAVWTLAVWWTPVAADPVRRRISVTGSDPESFSLYLSWNVHALTHGKDPFYMPNMYAPEGIDLGNAISVPSVSLLVAPISAAWGGTAGYNCAAILSIFLGAFCVYLFAREVTGSVGGATVAGALMVVSPYVAGHALGHLNLMWTFGLPLLAYLMLRFVRGSLSWRWLVAFTAATVAFTIGASTELMLTEAIFSLVGIVIAWFAASPRERRRLGVGVGVLVGGVVAGVALSAPVILAGLRSGIPETAANLPAMYSTDFTNLIAPTQVTWIGDSFFAALRSSWTPPSLTENTGYLPVFLLAIILTSALVHRTRAQRALWVFLLVALLFSFGPRLKVAGFATVPLPWELATRVPGLDHALPGRFSAFVFMAATVLVAVAWSCSERRRWLTRAGVMTSIVMLLPSYAGMGVPGDSSDPAPRTVDVLRDLIDPGENVLVLPSGQNGPGMRWMDDLDFAFTMPTGNGGGARTPEVLLTDPVAFALFGGDTEFDYSGSLAHYLERNGVSLVLIDSRYPEWNDIVADALPVAGELDGGVWVYEVSG